MKGSDRTNFNGSMEIDYVHGKWNVRQLLTIGLNTSEMIVLMDNFLIT